MTGTTVREVEMSAEQAGTAPWRDELLDIVRAVSGGMLFGVPLLYTMEVWWIGTLTTPSSVAIVLVGLAVPVFALNPTDGFRSTRDVRVADALADTVETLAIALVATASVLIVLREITLDTPTAPALGEVIYESVPFCLGIGVARHFLAGGRDGSDRGRDRSSGVTADLAATAIGAVFVSLSIAPTDEVPMLASAMHPAWLLVVMAASLLVSYAIVFVAGFVGQDDRHAQEGPFQHPITETVVAYLLSLVVALVLLSVFQRGLGPWHDVVARVVILGFPAAVGGAAGRLAA